MLIEKYFFECVALFGPYHIQSVQRDRTHSLRRRYWIRFGISKLFGEKSLVVSKLFQLLLQDRHLFRLLLESAHFAQTRCHLIANVLQRSGADLRTIAGDTFAVGIMIGMGHHVRRQHDVFVWWRGLCCGFMLWLTGRSVRIE